MGEFTTTATEDRLREALEKAAPGAVADAPPAYLEDPRGRVEGQAGCLVRPRSTEEVAAIVRLAAETRTPILPYGGGTGLVGGQVQAENPGTILLSLERMNRITPPDPSDHTMVAEAGAILADIQASAKSVGFLFPLSLASEGSCRIGGNLATNAGGVNVLRYGSARDLCLGIEAVLPDGSVFDGMAPLRKDNTGYDLRNLLIGSEGTLGIITGARLKVFPTPQETITALFEIPEPEAAIRLLALLRSRLGEVVSAHELIHRTGINFLEETMPQLRLPPSGSGEWLALTEVASSAEGSLAPLFEAVLGEALAEGLVLDGQIAQSEAQRTEIWQLRESIPEANRLVGAIASHDISVPITALPTFITDGFKAIAAIDPTLRVNSFGHVGDGNLHYNVFPPKGGNKADYRHLAAKVTETVHDLVHSVNGSISAEHGIGRAKKGDLVKYGNPAKLAAMRAIKQALDPYGIMNPGAVIDL